jgi:hypothetical protein
MTTDTTPTGTASCPICRTPFTATQPRHRYCSQRCRKTAWRRRHARSSDQDGVPRVVVPRPETVPHPRDVPRDAPRDVPRDVAALAGPPETSPPTRCPHCHRPIAVINLLVAPAAAQVSAPRSPHGH